MAIVLVINKIANFAAKFLDMGKTSKPVKKVATSKTVKPVAKKAAAKPAPKKVTAKPAAKAVTKKAAAKPVAKKAVAKPAVKKPVAKAPVKAAVKKTVQKPIAKKPAAPVKPVKKAVSKAAKPAPKKTVLKETQKKAAVAKTAKPAPKKVIAKAAPAKAVAKPVAKKAVVKPAPVKAAPAKPVAKAPVKPVAPAKKAAAPVKAVAKKDTGKPAKQVEEKHVEDPIIAQLIKPEPKEGARRPRPKSFPKPEPAKPLEKVPTPVKQLPTPIVRENKNRAMVSTATSPTTTFVNSKDAPNMRYSDKELKEFKELIEQKLESAREELKALKSSLDNHNDSQSGSKAWNMEEGTDTTEMEYLMNQISRQHTYIRNLELAMVRVENKTYGICRATGLLIPKERLRVVPHATLSIEAKNNRRPEDHPIQSVAPPVLGDGGDGGPSFEE